MRKGVETVKRNESRKKEEKEKKREERKKYVVKEKQRKGKDRNIEKGIEESKGDWTYKE
jgi:hypothetical protein